MKNKIFFTLIIANFLCVITNAQHITVRGLEYNTEVASQQKKKFHKSVNVDFVPPPAIDVPFIDDFYKQSIVPDTSYWVKSESAYVNNHFANTPPSIGVVTLDAMNEAGEVYSFPAGVTSMADNLESRRLKLEGKNDVYISFVYQPGGKGLPPNPTDTLLLQFYSPDSSKWNTVWKAINYDRDSAVVEVRGLDTIIWKPNPVVTQVINNDDTTYVVGKKEILYQFKDVIVEVEPDYLKDNFKFRFVNYINFKEENFVGRTGNNSMWHLDYIHLDADRDSTDTIINDIAFINQVDSVLKNYTSIPASHFGSDLGINQWTGQPILHIKNNYLSDAEIEMEMSLQNNFLNEYEFEELGYDSVRAGTIARIPESMPSAISRMRSYLINEGADSASFTFQYVLEAKNMANDRRGNDTMKYDLVMDNYYAYDDGSAEKTISTTKEIEAAVRFKSLKPDRLMGVYFHFVKPYMHNDLNTLYFNLIIRDAIGDAPGDTLSTVERPLIYAEDTFGISSCYYELRKPLDIENTFFVGWQKLYRDDYLNLGLDTYADNSKNNLAYFNGRWANINVPGTFMIRPVFGRHPNKGSSPMNVELIDRNFDIKVYPNPVNHVLYIDDFDYNSRIQYRIADLQGRIIKAGVVDSGEINCTGLKDGIYFFSFEKDGLVTNKKIIVAGK